MKSVIELSGGEMFPEAPSNSGINRLNHLIIKAFLAKPVPEGARDQKISDGGSLYLVAYPTGKAVWRFKYRLGQKERAYTIGRWPGIGLDEARRQREALRIQVQEGKDPVMARRVRRVDAMQDADHTFGNAFHLWLETRRRDWSAIHLKTSKRAIERDILPLIGRMPVTDIGPMQMSQVIEPISNRGAVDTAFKVLQHCSGVYSVAIARGWCTENPCINISAILPKSRSNGRIPAVLEFDKLGDILRNAEAARLSPSVRLAHRLAAFTVARMGNITLADWNEFHFGEDPAVWVIPRAKMKAQNRFHDHKIILPPAIVNELIAWRRVVGSSGYVFPTPTRKGPQVRPISREAVEKAYRETLALKDVHTPHGWRAAFTTLAKDHGFDRDVVELALDHVHDNEVVRAYDRGERLAQRIKLMYWWGEELIKAQKGGDLVHFPKEKVA